MKIKPEIPSGFNDLLPSDAIAQDRLFEKIKGVYESFGFVPLDTPCMERINVLTGGDPNFNKSIFVAKVVRGAEDRGAGGVGWDDSLGLRFDLTVPLARVVSAYPDLPKPFKRYQIGKVWRGESAQAGRYREFYQCDFDIIGSDSIISDVEVIMVMNETLLALGVENFIIRFNSRKILNGLAEVVGCADKAKDFLRIIDKSDKIGVQGVLAELGRKPDNEFDETALALNESQIAKTQRFLNFMREGGDNVLKSVKNFFGDEGIGSLGVKELEYISSALNEIGLPKKNWEIDLSVARGLDYYTGPVFETILTDMPELGSVFSGGRFDGLTNRFMEGSNVPGVGASVGLSRLMVALKKMGLFKEENNLTEVLVAMSSGLNNKALQISQELRKAGINTEVYLGQDYTFRAQLSFAAKKNIPFVVIIGEDEVKSGMVQLKNMATRCQNPLKIEEAIAKIKKELKK